VSRLHPLPLLACGDFRSTPPGFETTVFLDQATTARPHHPSFEGPQAFLSRQSMARLRCTKNSFEAATIVLASRLSKSQDNNLMPQTFHRAQDAQGLCRPPKQANRCLSKFTLHSDFEP
jgi:hypothetical protein